MDVRHENHLGHGLTLQQLLHALNEELSTQAATGQLTSDLYKLCCMEHQAKHALSTIHSSMNTVLPINRLPLEVLALIPYFLDSHKDLVNTTHVCRHWRNTFIASPPLWSRLDNNMMHEDLVAAYMDRCGATPLDVTFSSDMGSINTSLLAKLVARSAHIRKICFRGFSWPHIAELSNAFDAPLPMLREADLGVSYSEVELPPFERPFLAGATNLVSLSLFDVRWRSGTLLHFVIPTLTHLILHFHDLRTPSTHELLELFRNSPLIEDINIEAFFVLDTFQEHSAFPGQFRPVDLPCLHYIGLNWAASRSQNTLLAHINYPPTCSVSMQAGSVSDVGQPPPNAFPKSWEAFSLPNLSSVTLRMKRQEQSTQCAVIVKELGGASISISHSQSVDMFVYRNDENDLVREPDRDRDDDHVFSAAVSLVRKLPLHWIREFVLEDLSSDEMSKPESFEIPPDLVKLICSDLPNLTTLSLTRTCVSEFFNMLTPPPSPPPMCIADLFGEGGESDPSPLPCPTLKVLEMRHPNWIASRHCREALEMTKARNYEKLPFERVLFHSPVVPRSMAKGMSLYVEVIDIQFCHSLDCDE